MWPFKRLKDNHRQGNDALVETAEDVHEAIKDLLEMIQANTKDITTCNTAINRVERKQNRWLELLNVRETEPSQPFPPTSEEAAAVKAAASQSKEEAGIETEE